MQTSDALGVVVAEHSGIEQIVIERKIDVALRPCIRLCGAAAADGEHIRLHFGAAERQRFAHLDLTIDHGLILREAHSGAGNGNIPLGQMLVDIAVGLAALVAAEPVNVLTGRVDADVSAVIRQLGHVFGMHLV